MKIFGFEIAKAKQKTSSEKTLYRRFPAARVDRLVADFLASSQQINDDLRGDLPVLRRRSREMVKSSSIYRRFIAADLRSVIGPKGIRLQMQVRDDSGKSDDGANNIIETGFKFWGRDCSISGELTWLDFQRIVRRTMLVDGEVFIRLIKGSEYNPYAFGLQILDCELFDSQLNQELPNGGRIVQSIEFDRTGRRVAYHAKDCKGDSYTSAYRTVRIPAKEIRHLYHVEFINQKRGFPTACASMLNMHHLSKYAEAEVIAARLGASKMGFYISKGSGNPLELADDVNGDHLLKEYSPGTAQILPENWDWKDANPTHPNGNFAQFAKEMKREIAAGIDMSYNQLANDLESVTYSSLRSGKLDEQDHWRAEQTYMVEHLCRPVFANFLQMFLLSDENPLPMYKYSKFLSDTWLPRSFPWVDPYKDAQASVLLIDNNLEAPQNVIGEQGEDMEEIYQMIQKGKELAKKYGIEKVNNNSKNEAKYDEKEAE